MPCPRTASLHACLNLCSNCESKDRLFTDINLREREKEEERETERRSENEKSVICIVPWIGKRGDNVCWV